VGFFRSTEEKAASRVRKEEDRYLRSPIGRADTAHARGDSIFQLALTVDVDSAATLSQIEAIGWRLENAGYAYEVDVSSNSNNADQVSSVFTSGKLTGVYILRRVLVGHAGNTNR
jgi:CYTH domain-containing protein